MSNHTPAPWGFNPETNEVVGGKGLLQGQGSTICKVSYPEWLCPKSGETYEDDDALEANARLIAAAPEMYEALKNLLENIGDQTMSDGEVLDEIESRAFGLITQIEGRADE